MHSKRWSTKDTHFINRNSKQIKTASSHYFRTMNTKVSMTKFAKWAKSSKPIATNFCYFGCQLVLELVPPLHSISLSGPMPHIHEEGWTQYCFPWALVNPIYASFTLYRLESARLELVLEFADVKCTLGSRRVATEQRFSMIRPVSVHVFN